MKKQGGKRRSASKTESKCDIELVGGQYDGKSICIVFPSPKYLVLSMGTELYERQDPANVLEATYRYTDNWATYKKWLKEQDSLIK